MPSALEAGSSSQWKHSLRGEEGVAPGAGSKRRQSRKLSSARRKGGRKGPARSGTATTAPPPAASSERVVPTSAPREIDNRVAADAATAAPAPNADFPGDEASGPEVDDDAAAPPSSSDQLTPHGPEKVQRAAPAVASAEEEQDEHAAFARAQELEAACGAHEQRARLVHEAEQRTEAMAEEAARELKQFRQAHELRLLRASAAGKEGEANGDAAMLAALSDGPSEATAAWGGGWLGQRQWQKERETHAVTLEKAAAEAEWLARDAEVAKAEAKELAEKGVLRKVRVQYFRNVVGRHELVLSSYDVALENGKEVKADDEAKAGGKGSAGGVDFVRQGEACLVEEEEGGALLRAVVQEVASHGQMCNVRMLLSGKQLQDVPRHRLRRRLKNGKWEGGADEGAPTCGNDSGGGGSDERGNSAPRAQDPDAVAAAANAAGGGLQLVEGQPAPLPVSYDLREKAQAALRAGKCGPWDEEPKAPRKPTRGSSSDSDEEVAPVPAGPRRKGWWGWWQGGAPRAEVKVDTAWDLDDLGEWGAQIPAGEPAQAQAREEREVVLRELRFDEHHKARRGWQLRNAAPGGELHTPADYGMAGETVALFLSGEPLGIREAGRQVVAAEEARRREEAGGLYAKQEDIKPIGKQEAARLVRRARDAALLQAPTAVEALAAHQDAEVAELAATVAACRVDQLSAQSALHISAGRLQVRDGRRVRRRAADSHHLGETSSSSASSSEGEGGAQLSVTRPKLTDGQARRQREQEDEQAARADVAAAAAQSASLARTAEHAKGGAARQAALMLNGVVLDALPEWQLRAGLRERGLPALGSREECIKRLCAGLARAAEREGRAASRGERRAARLIRRENAVDEGRAALDASLRAWRGSKARRKKQRKKVRFAAGAYDPWSEGCIPAEALQFNDASCARPLANDTAAPAPAPAEQQHAREGKVSAGKKAMPARCGKAIVPKASTPREALFQRRFKPPSSSVQPSSTSMTGAAKKVAAAAESGKAGRKFRAFVAASGWVGDTRRGLVVGAPQPSIATWLEMHGAGHQGSLQGSAPTASAYHGRVDERQVRHLELKLMQEELEEEARLRRVKRRRAARQAPSSQPADVEERARVVAGLMQRPRGGRGGGEHLKLLMNRRGRGGVDEGASSSDDSGEETSSETRDLLLAIYFGGADKIPGRLVDGTDGLSVEEQVAKAHAPTAAERAAEARQEAIDAKERATAAAMPVASSEGEAAPRPILKGWAQRALLTAAAGRERRAARAKLTADEAARATARAKRLEQEARTEALRGEYMRKQQGEQEAEAKQKQEQMQKVLRSGAAAGTPLEKKAAADAEREMAAKAERVRQKAIATIQKRYAEVSTKAGTVVVPPPPRTLIEGAVRLRRVPGAKSFSVFWAALSDDGVLRLWRDRQEAGVLLPHEIEAKELATAEVAAERAARAADGSNGGSGDDTAGANDTASVASGASSRAASVGGTKRKRPRRTTRVVRALKWDGQGCTETYDNAFGFECNETAKVKVAAESGKPGGNMVQVQRRSTYQAMAASPGEAKQWGAAVGHAVAAAEQRREMRQAAEKRVIAKARRVAAEREAGKTAEHRATERLRGLERSKRDPRQGGGGIGEHGVGQVEQLRPPNTKGGVVLEEPTAEQLAEDEASREEARAAMEAAREANALQKALQAGADDAVQQEKRRCELENEQQAVDKEDGKAALAEMEALLALEGVDEVEREGAVRRAREESEGAEAAVHAERCMLDEAELRAESQLAEVGQRDSKQGNAGADASDTQKKLAEASQEQQAPSQESDLFRSRIVMRAMGGGIAPQINADMARAKASHWEHVKRGKVLKAAIALAKSTAKRWGRQKANGSTTTAATAATAAAAASEEESAGGDPVRKLLGSRAAEELEKAKMELDAAGPLVQMDAKIFALKTRIAAGTGLEMGNDSGGDDDDDDDEEDDDDASSDVDKDEQKAQDHPSAALVTISQEGKPTAARVHVPPWAEELSHKRNGEALKPVRRPRETDPDAPAAAGRRAEASARAQALGREEQGEWMAVPAHGAEGTDGGDLTSHQHRPREQSVPAASSLSKKVFFLPNVLYKFKRTHPLGWRPGARDASGSITPAPDGEREIPSLDLSGLSVVPPPKTPPSSPPVRSGRRGGKPLYGGVGDDETVVFEPYRRLGWRWLGIGLSMKQRSRPKKAQVVRFEGRGSPTKARRRFLRLRRVAREQVEAEAKVAAEATARGEAAPEAAEDLVLYRTEAKEPVGDDKESLQDATQRKDKKGKKPKKSKKKHGAVVQPAVETFAEYWDDSSDTDDDFGNNAELKATKRAKQKGGERMVSANLHKNADMSHLESSAARGSKKATKIAERLKEAEAALVASELAADTLREKRTRAATRLAQEPTSLFSRSKEALYRAHPASYVHAVGRGVRNFYRTRFEAKVADLAEAQPAPRLVFNWRLSRQARRADARVDKSIYRRPGCDGLSDEDDEEAPTTPRPVIQTRSMRRATKAMACDRCGAGAQHGSWRKWSLKRERRSTALPGEGGPSGAEALRMARVAGAKVADVTHRVAALAHNAVVTLLGWPMVQAAGSSARVVLHDDGLVLCRACAANELRGRSPRAPGEEADLSSQCDIHLPSSPRRTDAECAPGGRAKAATPTERREVAARREARAKRVRAQELEEVAPPLAIVVAFQAVAGPLLRAFERWRVRRERKRFELAVMVGSKEKIVDFFHQGFRDPCTVHFRDAQGRTALVLAAAQNHSGVAEYLVHMLKSIADKEEEKALRRGAAGAGDAPKPKPFYPEIDLDTRDERHGWAALHWAAHHGNGYLAHVLLSAGASLHARTKKGLTPLMVACAAGQAASSDVLLGADESLDHLVGGGVKITASKYPAWRKKMLAQLFMSPKLRDDNGMTALHHAAHAGSADCAMILLEADFSPRAKDGAHAIPSDYARRAGNDALILLLNEAMFGVDYHKHQNELEEEDDWFKSEKEKKRILRKKNRKIRRVNDARTMAAQIDFEAKEAETHTGKDLPSWWLGVDANGCAVDLGGGAQRSEGNAPDDAILLDLHEQQVAANARMQGAKEQRQRYAQYRRSDGLAPFAEAVSNPSDPQLNALQRLRFTVHGEMIDPGPEVPAIEAARRVTTPADAVNPSNSTHITHI